MNPTREELMEEWDRAEEALQEARSKTSRKPWICHCGFYNADGLWYCDHCGSWERHV